ncbi:histidine phosphatase family protein [Paenactinomyces guangxiensis]|uniref:Histidine phosphatase family protein n=1 Tax=Paenactinomyces guangxiensis TaxID=1490290 RepID=A0A7W1WMT3_9BACL|nr:histidine phosphatase family protein [Paenactinomyces guangxiensis]MBA4492803.1 histidine phosphatase family protein [Paenactinomyces guangxiensis]MBH8590348.1 histidine phosphatase family protein [Paenactinomyces guangxiensis]
MQLIWLRHGETGENAAGRYLGHLDPPLNSRGRQQARRLADSLQSVPVDYVYMSDLFRARQTAEAFLQLAPGLSSCRMKSLRELSFGEWEGYTFQEISTRHAKHVQEWLSDPFQTAPPGGESLNEMDVRLSGWLNRVEQTHSEGEVIAVFTHGGPIRWFLSKMVRRDWSSFWDPPVPHGSGWIVQKRDDGWKTVRMMKTE